MRDDKEVKKKCAGPNTPAGRGVVLASPGGLAGGGGMGSVTRAMKQWADDNRPELEIEVIDPRGEGHALRSLVHWPVALARLLKCRVWNGHDVLHLQVSERLSFVRKGALLFVGRALGMRVVLHHHGAELIPFFRAASPRMRRLVEWSARNADINIVLGEVWREFLIDEVGVPAQRVVIAINATRDVSLRPHPAQRDPWNFLVLANLSPRKGIDELLEAIAILRRSGAPARLTLAGGGDVQRYRLQAERLAISPYCTFTGWIQGEAVVELLFTHSALVLPSHAEGLPMTIIEALSARLPVLTTPVGSIPDHLQNDLTCVFVAPGNVAELAEGMRRLATDADLRDRLSANGRALYEDRFGLDGYMQRMVDIYEGIPRKSDRVPPAG